MSWVYNEVPKAQQVIYGRGTRKAIFWSVRVYNKNLSSQCNLLAQIEQEIVFILQYNVNQDKTVRKKHEKNPNII